MKKLKKVIVMAGGTGGHVFPGLAVAKRMLEKGIEVHWLGTEKGLEAKLVPAAGFPIHFINISGLRGKGITNLLLTPFKLIAAIYQAQKIINQIKPDLVLGMGGFVSGPGGIASWILRTPIIIHEQNAKAGMTNTWLARVANKVLEAFPKTFSPSKKVITVGNPVRAEIAAIVKPEERLKQQSPLRLLILGGSLGAQAINVLVPQVLAKIPLEERPEVLHQTGDKHLETTKDAYREAGISLSDSIKVVPFIQEMDDAYSKADLVLCRAGALTVSELCAAGLGAILIPFPFAVDDHQTANGNFMAQAGAAILIQQQELNVEKLAALLKEFYSNKEKCITMAKAAYALRRVDATEKVLTICEDLQ